MVEVKATQSKLIREDSIVIYCSKCNRNWIIPIPPHLVNRLEVANILKDYLLDGDEGEHITIKRDLFKILIKKFEPTFNIEEEYYKKE